MPGCCDPFAGLAISCSAIYPKRQKPQIIKAERRAPGKLGAQGFPVYHFHHLSREQFRAVGEVFKPATKPAL